MSVSPPSPRADSWTTPSIAKVKKDEDWTLKGGGETIKKREKKKEKQAETYRLLPRQDEREATSLLCQSGAHRIHFVRVIILLLEPINRSSVCGHFRQRWVEANRISTEIDLSWMGNQKKKKTRRIGSDVVGATTMAFVFRRVEHFVVVVYSFC